jgi:hypothetical protein
VINPLGVLLSSETFPATAGRLPGIAGLGESVRHGAAGRGGVHRLLWCGTRSVLNKSGVHYGPEEGRPMPCGWSAKSLRADEGSFVLAR